MFEFKIHVELHFPAEVIDLLGRILKHEERIMATVQDFAAKVQANFDKLGADLDSIKAEIGTLNDKIQTLQNSQGQLGPSDQAALDDIAVKSQALADKADALSVPPVPPAPTT